MIRPKYPKRALRDGTGTKVDLQAVIEPDGRIKDVTVQTGENEFSQNAMAAIRKWRFHPQRKQGKPVETIYKIHVRFSPLLREANSDVELESPQPDSPKKLSVDVKDADEEVHSLQEPGMVAPKQIYSPEPEFSEVDRKSGAHGNVGIAFLVGADGLPRNLKIVCSSLPDSNENALAAVRTWKFAPGTFNGKRVAVPVEVEISFKRH